MGSSSSRAASRSPPPPHSENHRRPKLSLATFLCGGGAASTSASPPQIKDQLSGKLALPAGTHGSVADDDIQCTIKESPRPLSSESSSSSSMNECLRTNAQISNGHLGRSPLSQNAETSNTGKCLSESRELGSCSSSAGSCLDRTHSKRACNLASTSSKAEHIELLSTSAATTCLPVVEVLDPMNNSVSPPSPSSFLRGNSQFETSDTPANGNRMTEVHGAGSALDSVATIFSSSNLPEVEPLLEATSSGGELSTVGERRHGSVLHVDVLSISSNIIQSETEDVSSNEARMNNRSLFWEAFARRSARRNNESSGMVLLTDDDDDLGSNDRWLLDIGGDLFRSRFDHDSLYLQRRSRGLGGRRWHSRSEIRERLRAGFDNDRRETTLCPLGLHPGGGCSCDSMFMREESSGRASISRIVLLAEALFEVLDEIHRQPDFLSLSTVSRPAPESVVDSLPVKSHTMHDTAATNDMEQCYICLAEYEEDDKIRVLPCHHEYHMSCVDKWLKEIHGVCPLCRRDVRQGTTEDAAEVAV